MGDSFPLGRGRHHFFPTRSFKAALSSRASAKSCGFDPPAQRRLWPGGTATDFLDARQKFAAAWRELLPRFTEDDFAAYRSDRAWNAWKCTMWETRHKLPTQLPAGRSKCFCGAEIDLGGVRAHVATHMDQPDNV
jgi:hypothetical protein